jgi:sugar (pentulose or hexulose) kinase
MDAEQSPLTPLILWPDRRATADPRLEALWSSARFLATTGLGLGGSEFCVHKLAWFQRQRPDQWKACSRVLTISDYLVHALAGVPAGDQGTAALLGLFDLPAGRWWNLALQTAGVPPEKLSRPLAPGTVVGRTSAAAERLLGVPRGIPLAVGSLDHHVGAIGAGICSPDFPSISIGTVVACVRYTNDFKPLPGCAMGPGTHGYPFYLLAFEENGTGALDRYHREHCPGVPFSQMLQEAESVPVGSDGLMASPATGGSPGSFQGVQAKHTRRHFVRALIESTAVSVLAMIRKLYPGGLPPSVAVTGGGARSDIWMQVLADLSGIGLVVPACSEAACRGAAMMAAVAAGWFDCLAEVTTDWSSRSRVITPDPERHERYQTWLVEYCERTLKQAGF